MASIEEDFPRGGTVKTTQPTKTDKAHVEVDNLFETRAPEVKKKRKSTNQQDEEQDVKKGKKAKDDSLKLNTASSVDILHMKDLKVGTLLLACAKEVNDFEIVVGLPSGLTGYLPVTNICESYNKLLSDKLDSGENVEDFASLPHLFSPGRVIRCVVSSLVESREGHVSLKVSINPKEVNKALTSGSLKAGMTISGCVESIEDHGYLIDIGLSGTKAFLPKPSAKAAKQELMLGQYVDCLLEEVKNEGRLVRLSVDPAAVSEAVADADQGWTLSNLCPGLLVNAKIKKVTVHGLILEFLSSFSGVVDFMHIDPDKVSSYKNGDEVLARVLYVEPSTRQVGLSLREHLLPPGGSALESVQSERVGEVLQGCKVAAVHFHSGAILELPDGTKAFGHKNQLKEPKEPFNPSHLQAQPELTCRITDFSPLEQLHLVSLRKSTIEAPFFRYNDLKAGQIVEGTIVSLARFGLFVKVTDHIKGMVPRIHMADVTLTNPEKKFTVGNKIKCRVLSVDVASRKLALTRKKGMVDSPLRVFATYADARVGRIAHGFVVCVKEFGCIVRFYGDVKGLVPLRELSTEHVMFPQQLFYVGQVVKAKVLQCDVENEKLLLSFRAVLEGETEGQGQTNKPVFKFEIGKSVEARVVSKVPDGLNLAILPEEAPAHLPTAHLSDHASNSPLLWEALQVGDVVSDAVCLSKTKLNVILTKKPLVRACLERGAAATEFSGLRLGLELTGWVKNVMPYGVFVEFPHGLYGLAPKAAMSDRFVESTEGVFQAGRTVRAKVTNLDEEKRRFLVSLKASELSSAEDEGQEMLTRGLREKTAAMEMIGGRVGADALQQLSSLAVGSRLKVTVDDLLEDGSCSFSSDDLPAVSILASEHHLAGVTVTSGQKVKAVVLQVDPRTPQVHVSLLPALLSKRKTLESGSKHEAQILHIDGDFAVVSIGDTAHVTVVPLIAHLNETFGGEAERPKAGDTLRGQVVVVELASEALNGLALVSREAGLGVSAKPPPSAAAVAATARRERTISEGRGSLHSFRCGDVVTAVVSAIKPMQVRLTLPGDVTGCAHVSELLEDPEAGSFPTSAVKVGQEVRARVIGGRDVLSHKFLPISHPGFVYSQPVLSLLPRKVKEAVDPKALAAGVKMDELVPGQDLICYASKYISAIKCLEVAVTPKINGTVELLAMTTNVKEAKRPEKLVKVGQAMKAKVVSVSTQPKRLFLSLTGTHTLSPGNVVIASVQEVKPCVGLLLKLPFGGKGSASILDLSDSYAPNPLQQYSQDQLVRCCILEAGEKNKYHVSLRPSRTHPDKKLPITDAELSSLEDLKESQVLQGYVAAVGDKGIFVRLSRTITGRVEYKKATNYYVKDHSLYSKHIPQNTLLTVKVLSLNSENSHVELSTLPGDTGKADLLPESLHLPLRKRLEKKTKRKRKISESTVVEEAPVEKKKKKKKKKPNTEDNDSGVEVYFREEDTESAEKAPAKVPASKSPAGPARLKVSAGFSWDTTLSSLRPAAAAPDHQSSAEEEEEEEQPAEKKTQKKTRKAQEAESKREEEELRQQEAELMDPAQRPQSAHAFERLLLASPDSSLVWLQYMAFHLQATEIEQARAVAERALKTISFREEQEKLNVWVALMNLENMYGGEESLHKVFERAVQYCEPMPVYQRLAHIYAQSNKIKEAEDMYKSMVKRFRQEPSVWQSYGTFLVRQGQSDAANALLQRALKSLSNKQHVDLITKFARLEFQHGDKDRGKAMFDKVLTSYPKRTDLWSVFIDLMIKHGNQQEVRELFDRVIHLSVAVKRIKFFFKRYLEYEKKNGTPETIQAVKQKALEYVESKGGEDAS
ncbi:protein RRP5 homolog [Sardina pilchardus]|uniref:protein RRP5 homolog n=1 Tax=Sardina pilchardus TaxID=27697 RepID=UPI002E111ECF